MCKFYRSLFLIALFLYCENLPLFGQVDSGAAITIVVDGTVEAVFLNTKISEPIYAIQLLPKSVSLSSSALPRGMQLPTPGETFFIIHESADNETARRGGAPTLPQPGQLIRTQLYSTTSGTWQTLGRNWFEVLTDNTSPISEPTTSDTTAHDSPVLNLRGMACEAKFIGGQLAFEVKSVEETGPAHEAGFQKGDVITAVSGKPLTAVATLEDLAAKSVPLELTVIDINTGRLAKVTLTAMPSQSATPKPVEPSTTKTNDDAPTVITNALGIEIMPTRIGVRKGAVVVTKVLPGQGGAEAGLEVGDVILAVKDQAVTDADTFANSLPAGGGTVTLLVRDSRSGEDVPVQAVCKSTGRVSTPPPVAKPTVSTGPTDDWGLATELTFYQDEAAVQVVAVQPGSRASRAGIQPGWIIMNVGDTPILHPDQLKQALSAGQRSFRLTVADPRTERELQVELSQ